MPRISLSLLLAILFVLSSHAIEPGSEALPIIADKWLNGEPVDPAKPDGQTVYVIDFWATTCPPCRRSLPLFTEIHERLSTQSVIVIGITTDAEPALQRFLAKNPIHYRLAIDTNASTALSYMGPDFTIPHAFIIDTNGTVAWSGHPLDGLEEAIDLVLRGEPVPPPSAGASEMLLGEIQELVLEGDLDAAIAKVDELIAGDQDEADYYQIKLGLLAQADRTSEFSDVYVAMLKAFNDSPENLNMLAWISSTSPPEACHLDVAWKAIQRAVELSQSNNASILDTLARVYYSAGLIEDAVNTEQAALAKADDAQEKAPLQTSLDFYQSALRLRTAIQASRGARENTP